MKYKTGLFLSKFAPMHKGHQYVIEKALLEVEKLVILIYDCPDIIDIPVETRAKWIETLYPMTKVIKCFNGPEGVGNTPEKAKEHDDYIIKVLNGIKIDAFYSSEFYGEHVSKALNAVDRRIDPDRKAFPISGTAMRNEPYKNREFVDPIVYQDMITNVVFLGAMSSGKSTITKRMAKEFNTVYMPEYGTSYWEKHQVDGKLTKEQLLELAQEHNKLEDQALLNANKYLFTDSNALTTYIFSLHYHGEALPELKSLADTCMRRLIGSIDDFITKGISKASTDYRYDKVFLCDYDIPFENAPGRESDELREVFQEMYRKELTRLRVPYILISGGVGDRVEQVKEWL
jgi:HTH-type transcriptional regulator, transcriptional repressor of NAD biosynthesis genes